MYTVILHTYIHTCMVLHEVGPAQWVLTYYPGVLINQEYRLTHHTGLEYLLTGFECTHLHYVHTYVPTSIHTHIHTYMSDTYVCQIKWLNVSGDDTRCRLSNTGFTWQLTFTTFWPFMSCQSLKELANLNGYLMSFNSYDGWVVPSLREHPHERTLLQRVYQHMTAASTTISTATGIVSMILIFDHLCHLNHALKWLANVNSYVMRYKG